MTDYEFLSYCGKIGELFKTQSDWRGKASSWVASYLGNSVDSGYGKVLCALTDAAYDALEEGCKNSSSRPDLYEIAGTLYFKYNKSQNYKLMAYYFAVGVVAVASGMAEWSEIDYEDFDVDELQQFDSTVSIARRASVEERRLEYYRIRLLDFSRNNPLVHFKRARASTLTLHTADIGVTMSAIAAKKRIRFAEWGKFNTESILKCKTCGRYAFRKYVPYDKKSSRLTEPCPVCDENNLHNRRSMTLLKEELTLVPEDGITCECSWKILLSDIRAGQRECPYCGRKVEIPSYPVMGKSSLKKLARDEVLCGVGDESAQETVKKMTSRERNMRRNFGLHVMYLACGFLHWTDAHGTNYCSPILLCPVNLVSDRSSGVCYIEWDQSQEQAFEVNKTLVHMLSGYSSTCSISLPKFENGMGGTFFSYIKSGWQSASAAIASVTKDWYITEELGIGLFHYQKLQLEYDLETHAKEYLSHPVIRRICGDSSCDIVDAPAKGNFLKYMVLDADSSQEEVIRAAQKGKSFILEGPPGSGKSQTISNIISVAIGSGKSVLFVTEKATARSVISDNLEKLFIDSDHKLTDYVLDFDRFSTRLGAIGREPFVTELNKCLVPYNRYGGYSDSVLAEESYYKGRVATFMEEMRGRDSDGRSYVRLLNELAPYAQYGKLATFADFKGNVAELLGYTGKFYNYVKCGHVAFNYSDDPLYSCRGDLYGKLAVYAEDYLDTAEKLDFAVSKAVRQFRFNFRWDERDDVRTAAELYRLWAELPVLLPEIAQNLTRSSISELLNYAKSRKAAFEGLLAAVGRKYEGDIERAAFEAADIGRFEAELGGYRNIFKRLSKDYKQLRTEVCACMANVPPKVKYNDLCEYVQKLSEFDKYLDMQEEYDWAKRKDIALFGRSPATTDEWGDLCDYIEKIADVFFENDKTNFNPVACAGFFNLFTQKPHAATVYAFRAASEELLAILKREEELHSAMAVFFEGMVGEKPVQEYIELAELVRKERHRLYDWYNFITDLRRLTEAGAKPVLDELIRRDVRDFGEAEGMIYSTYWLNEVNDFADKNGLTEIESFDADAHAEIVRHYAQADTEMLRSGAERLYEKLSAEKKRAAELFGARHRSDLEYPRLKSKKGYSIKQTINENWDYIRAIKPCFMMSPLNVSQYIDMSVKFDMVIFDEASQIFTEDALASIARGNQIIIVGDSKQLPPCDFFRAGDVSRDLDEQFYEEDENQENSILNAANDALGDIAISLCWHYRSCDERLIAFSNEHFGYNLITFPSAVRNPNDGIEFVGVPYDPANCYVSGKSGSHVNPAEADRIVQLIWREINHPERSKFTLGVVAFSNAQALEIETRWAKFREDPARKPTIEAWEKAHASESLIFCNLDTMQGDERDTMLLSICYSKDASGKFNLPYLGRIRLSSGKKRINVAITRSRHRMIVVSMLNCFTLQSAIDSSSAPEHNKEGAVALCEFLNYAATVQGNAAATAPPANALARSICRVLDEAGFEYDTEIGMSSCKINIGVKKNKNSRGYALGIIIDDPSRSDFDSPREYARLTEHILCTKYGWNIYRIYPIAWVKNYERERSKLLNRVSAALN